MERRKRSNPGKEFEQDIKASFPPDCFVERYKDDTAGFHGVCNPADFRVYRYPLTFLIECKSHKGKSLPLAKIRMNQLKEMLKAVVHKGVYGGYIINYRELGETYYLRAQNVKDFMEMSNRKSIPVDFCRQCAIRIPQELKRTRYKYDIESWLRGYEGL